MNAVPAGYAPPTGPDRPAPGRRWLRWLLAATVAWAVLLAVLTWNSVRDDPPTVREQRTLAEAGPVVDRAVGELLAAVGDGGVATLAPDRIGQGCRITPLTDGAALERRVDVRVAGDDVRGLLQRVADRLPASWRAGVSVTSEGPVLRADAGEFVTVEGRSTGPGRVRLTADTGCRPIGSGYRAPQARAGAEATAVAEALRALGGPAGLTPALSAAPCPSGGRVAHTARATTGAGPKPLATALAPVAAGAVVLDTVDAYAYRRGPVTVLAERTGDQIHVTATTPCTP
ncbi:hypothetical protein GA0070624_0334 [Micromonospora rhizosphaerae]|uniref:Uncharacterized protein n=1 Tax=Micromonospora rhizosphaerae TaxID=568872 RepID=A0A1C6RAI3_9ACTN|nr:hypothetical protein [Micromonospora rhizosphaerae]SCL14139.1 hypothetical protein GA0070624_0334 [Micromonospora rhizosphaerae]